MMQSGRWIASLVYLAAIAATLGVAFTIHGAAGGVLVVILLIVQFLAFVWYCATYIPGERRGGRARAAPAAARTQAQSAGRPGRVGPWWAALPYHA
jgi:hypothetical protein